MTNTASRHSKQLVYVYIYVCVLPLTSCISHYHVEESISGRCAVEDGGWFLIEHPHTREPHAGPGHLETAHNLALCSGVCVCVSVCMSV